MSRIAPVSSPISDPKVADTLSQVKESLGRVPNALATIANSPVALDGYLSLSRTLSRGRLTGHQRELLALTIAQENKCQYCLSAHTASSKAGGLTTTDVVRAREGISSDPFDRALLSFTKNIVRQRGLVSDRDMDLARKAGIDDGLMLEVVATIALNTLTNYANRLADPQIDFPVVAVELEAVSTRN